MAGKFGAGRVTVGKVRGLLAVVWEQTALVSEGRYQRARRTVFLVSHVSILVGGRPVQ
ncbi:MAG: hypothetical protein ACKVHR_05070 [Pirellulales bacterium]